MKQKPYNPYSSLLQTARQFAADVERSNSRKSVAGCSYKVGQLPGLSERVVTADQLGFDTKVTADGDSICIVFVERKKAPTVPWRFI